MKEVGEMIAREGGGVRRGTVRRKEEEKEEG